MASTQNNLAYYLKYRPQAFDGLVGQESVKKTLLSAFEQNRLAHAYLLVGPRGTGKTSTARILAKMVNCSAKQSLRADALKEGVPCNKCEVCLSITDGSNMDLIEIDAASNRGIEDIRSLRERIKLSPSGAGKKVYIIDEVHMLTTEAFNALLKTLEEPPAHALFILATTDVSKVPQTILSRVQRLDFKLATSKEVLEALEKIVKEEKLKIDDEALKLLAKHADGSFRDGVKLLDQVASLGEKITEATILAALKSSNFDDQINLLEKLALKKGAESLLEVNKQIEGGVDTKDLIISLQELMRSLWLLKNGVGELVKENFTEEKWQKLVEVAGKFNNSDLIKGLDSLQKAFEKLRFSSIPRLSLEIAVIEICGSEENLRVDSRDLKLDIEARRLRVEENLTSNIQPQNPTSSIQRPASKQDDSTSSGDIQKLKEKWTFVLETIRPYNFSLEALLRSVNITECTDTTLIMEVPYSFHQRILEAPKNRDLLESILSEILGRGIRVSTVLGERIQRTEDIANIEIAQDDEIIRVAAEIFNSDSIN